MSSLLYVGRMVGVGMTASGKLAVIYRVSSRSFPHRFAIINGHKISIAPQPGYETDILRNPYIAYNCAQVVGKTVILSNGSHTDPLAEKIAAGMPARDAFIYGLATLDYEKDAYNTPRIAAAVTLGEKRGWLGIVRADGLEVQAINLQVGKINYVATYEHDHLAVTQVCALPVENAESACRLVLGENQIDGVGAANDFAKFANPITAVCAVENEGGFALAVS